MLYLKGKIWDKADWMKILRQYVDLSKPRKKPYIFQLSERFRGMKKKDDKWVPTWPESLNYPMQSFVNMDGEDVEIRYAKIPSRDVPGKEGKSQTQHDADRIIFTGGVLEVKPTDLDLYLYLLLVPNNETNPTYYKKVAGKMVKDPDKWPTTINFFFREKNEELEQADAYDSQKASIEAQNYVINLMSEAEARELYKLENQHDWEEAPLKRIKNFLLVKAREKPHEFMESVNSDIRTVKSKVIEAINGGVIHFDHRKGWWKWTGEGGGKIIQVARGQDETLALVKFLNEKDNGTVMAALEGKVIAAEDEAMGSAAPVKKAAKKAPPKKKTAAVAPATET